MDWSGWHSVDKWGSFECPREKGVYCVRAVDDDGNPIPIMRSCGMDNDGIVYYGEGTIHDRIGHLSWITSEDANEHRHHPLVHSWFDYGLERIDYHRTRQAKPKLLQVRWRVCQNCKEEEYRLLVQYRKEFGDTPPGNSQMR